MSDEIMSAIIQSIGMTVAVGIGFYVTRKTKKLDWNEEQAKEFLICSRSYSETVSKILVSLFIFFSDSKQAVDQKEHLEKTVHDLIRNLQLLGWEIKRHSLSAKTVREEFLKQEANLFLELSKIISQVSGSIDSRRVDLENIRALQNNFDESARKLHAELCALK